MVVTVAGLVTAPLVDRDPSPSASPSASLADSGPSASPAPSRPVRSVDRAPAHVPSPTVARVGVASLHLSAAPAVAATDARRLARRSDVDVVGWQGAARHRGLLRTLPGWSTVSVGQGLAVSWRTAAFRLRSARDHGAVGQVVLQRAGTRRLLTVIDARLPAGIEDAVHLGRWAASPAAGRGRAELRRLAAAWRGAPGRWVVATGDLSFGARADARVRSPQGPRRALRAVALSTYEVRGDGTPPTFRPQGRRFDYVWVDRAALRAGRLVVVRHRVLPGYGGEHRPLLATLRLA